MEEKIFEIISSWAKVPTWYTSHPLDEKRFNEAINELVTTLGTDIEPSHFEAALKRHVKKTPSLLGEPSEWDNIITKFTNKAMAIISYEECKKT